MKERLRDFFHTLGLDIRRWDDMSVFSCQLIHILKYLEIDLVLDVGAHEGQYAQMLFRTGYAGEIISYEPLPASFRVLRNIAVKSKNFWAVSETAVGDETGVMKLHIAGGNKSSSSLLPMHQRHIDAAPHTAYVGEKDVPVQRLDDIVHPTKNTFLKIDTQGYEMQVLMGATGIIDRIRGVQVEMSTCTLYDGQALDWEIKNWLVDKGFELWAVNPFMYDPKTGRLLQYDAIFVRP